MYHKNILSRLCSYSLNKEKHSSENFLTEVFAHLFETDPWFKRIFLGVLITDRRKIRRFLKAKVRTQVFFKRSYVDLVLTPQDGPPLLVEVKIRAAETWTDMEKLGSLPQVKKYLGLRKGPVLYLASVQAPDPEVGKDRRYWGRVAIERLHQELKTERNFRKLSYMGKQLVAFLEDKDMSYVESFTPLEIKRAQMALGFPEKAKAFLDEAAEDHKEVFRKLFKSRKSFSSAKFVGNEAYVTWKGKGRRRIRWVGFSIGYYDDDLFFTMWLRVYRNSDIAEDAKGVGLYQYEDSDYWGERVALRGGPRDKERVARCVKRGVKKFRRII